MTFTPLKDFWSPELMSQYVVGQTYTVRPADCPTIASDSKDHQRARKNRAKLAELVPQWVEQRLVRITGGAAGDVNAIGASRATVVGTGEVK